MTNLHEALQRRMAARARRRHAQAGVTLFEVLIVVAIMATLSTGVALYVLPKFKDTQIKAAKQSAQVLRQAVQQWQALNNETSCPTVAQLVESKEIDSTSGQEDPWGSPWGVSCTDDEVYVQSSGPDKKAGTDDDISVPKLRDTET